MSGVEVKAGRLTASLRESLAVSPRRGTVNLFWLGQAGFALRTADGLAVIDPYLSDALAEKYQGAHFKHTRMMPPPVGADELRGVDLLLATHAHSDHLDPGSVGKIMEHNPGCRLACPAGVVPTALERGADRDRTVGMRVMERRRFGPFTVELLPSAHEELKVDENGDTAYGGFIIEAEGVKIYHSGDCVPFAGLAAMVKERGVDVALLPVNGRDAERRARGVPGNFTLDEAALLCLEAGVSHLLPHHFGMFDFNTVAPEAIRTGLEKYAARGLRWSLPDVGSCFSVAAARPAGASEAG